MDLQDLLEQEISRQTGQSFARDLELRPTDWTWNCVLSGCLAFAIALKAAQTERVATAQDSGVGQ